ncbi:hypothetical protein WDU94_008495 [Cyamophila willieti]
MFTFYFVFTSVFICFSHCIIPSESSRLQQLRLNFPSNLSWSYLDFQNKSFPFSLKTLNQVSNNGNQKFRYKFATRGYYRKKNFLQKQLLDFKNDAELINCIHTFVEGKTPNASILDQQTIGPDRNLHTDMISLPYRNTTIHTLKDLMRNHIVLNQTKMMFENENTTHMNSSKSEILTKGLNKGTTSNSNSLILIPLNAPKAPSIHRAEMRLIRPNVNYVGNNIGAVKALFNYHERKKSSLETFPNISVVRRYKPIANNQIQFYIRNEHGNRLDVANGEISTKINIEKNVKNNTVKEIMIIEIPIKSPMLRDKNLLVDLNEIKDMTSDEGPEKSTSGTSIQKVSFKGAEEIPCLKEVQKDIEKRVELNIVKYLDEFKHDIFTNLSKLIGQKHEDDRMKINTPSNLQKKLKEFNYLSDHRVKYPIIYDQTPRNMFPFTTDGMKDQDHFKFSRYALDSEEALRKYLIKELNKTENNLKQKHLSTNVKINHIIVDKTEEPGKCLHFHSSTKGTPSKNAQNKCTTTCRTTTEECSDSISTDVDHCTQSTPTDMEHHTDSLNVEMTQSTPNSTNAENNTQTQKEFNNQLLTLYDIKQSNSNDSKLKDIIALYDIDLQHPKELFLAPKGFLSNMSLSTDSTNPPVSTNASNTSVSTNSNRLNMCNIILDVQPENTNNFLTNNNNTMLHSKCCKPSDRFKEVEAKCVNNNVDVIEPKSNHRTIRKNYTELNRGWHCEVCNGTHTSHTRPNKLTLK